MMYQCRITDRSGKIKRKRIQGNSISEIEISLHDQGLDLLEWEEEQNSPRITGNHQKAILELTQSLGLMIQSGISLKEAFEVSQGLFTKGKTAVLVERLNRQLQKGDSFAQAIATQETLFPPLYIGMIQVGQRLGQLEKILTPLSQWLQERKDLKDKILGALIYPALVLSMVFIGVSALLFLFLPQLELLSKMAGENSQSNLHEAIFAAKVLIALFGGLILLVPISVIIINLLKKKKPFVIQIRDMILLKIPILNRFFLVRDMLSLSFALSILTECGVTLEDSLEQAAGVVENTYLKSRLIVLQTKLLKGDSLSHLLSKEPVFPLEFGRWVALGERIGSIDKVFKQLKTYYQQEMQKILNAILSLVEPIVIILLGVIILIVILKIILPLLTMYGGSSL